MSAALHNARAAAIWLAFACALVLATEPSWGYFVFGFNPTLEDLLTLRCLPWVTRQ